MTKILVVEDECIVAMDLLNNLQRAGYDVGVVSSGEAAIDVAEQEIPDLVLMDIKLKGGIDGIQAAKKINARLGIPIMYLTAYSDSKTRKRADSTVHFGYLYKPFNFDEVLDRVRAAITDFKTNNKKKSSRGERQFASFN
jgi:DNA-binding response OmpR family regulator